jgi:hypothetical protein
MADNTIDERPPELVAASTASSQLGIADLVVRLEIPDSTQGTLRTAIQDESRRLLLRVEDLVADEPPDASYNVFLLRPGSSAVDVGDYLGTVTFFGVEMRDVPGHDEAPGRRKVFDVTDVINRKAPDEAFSKDSLEVMFVPIRIEATDEGDSAQLLDEQATRLQRANVRIGRVALYLA